MAESMICNENWSRMKGSPTNIDYKLSDHLNENHLPEMFFFLMMAGVAMMRNKSLEKCDVKGMKLISLSCSGGWIYAKTTPTSTT